MKLLDLPSEVLFDISFELNIHSRAELAKTCRQLYEILKSELQTAEQCWRKYPESAPLNLPQINWSAEKSYWESIESNWLNNRYIEKHIETPPSSCDYLCGDHLYIRSDSDIAIRIYDLKIWNLSFRPEPRPIAHFSISRYGLSASYMLTVETWAASEFQLYRRTDFVHIKTVQFPKLGENSEHFGIVQLNDNFVVFRCEPMIYIFDLRNETWDTIEPDRNLYKFSFEDSDILKVSGHEYQKFSYSRLLIQSFYQYDGRRWLFQRTVRTAFSREYDKSSIIAHKKTLNPSVYMVPSHDDSSEAIIMDIDSGSRRIVPIAAHEEFMEANSDIYFTFSSNYCVNEYYFLKFFAYQVSTGRKLFTIVLDEPEAPGRVLISGKYFIYNSYDGFPHIRDYTNGTIRPHFYVSNYIGGHEGYKNELD